MGNTTTDPEIDFEALRQIAGDDGLLLDPARLEAVAVDGITPQALLRPETNEQAATFLKYANSHGLKVAVRGGGTKTELGNPIANLDLVVSTERLNRVLEYSPADLTLGVQAGANLQEIQDQLELNGQFLPISSPLSSLATIGGAIATNSSGPDRLQYGPARDWLIGVRFALPEGIIAHGGGRVVKNVAGYDMMKIFIGSLGTLGLILDLNFKLMPLPTAGTTLIAAFDNAKTACETALMVIDAGLFPTALTVLDSGAGQMLGLEVPGQGVLLLIEARNTPQAVERQAHDMNQLCGQNGCKMVERLDEREAQRLLWQTVTNFAYLNKSDSKKSFVLKAAILPAKSAEMLEFVHRSISHHHLEITSLAHVGHGILYFIATYEDEEAALQVINETAKRVEAGQGSIAVEQMPLSLKLRLNDVWGNALNTGELELMRNIKTKLDPQNTLNPGRFVARI
jgi:glycolate oxidase FAD binding subunit